MEKLLAKLGFVRQLVPIAYVAGLVSGTMQFFAGVTIGGRNIIGVCIGGAVELHTFFLQRQLRADYALWRIEKTATARGRLLGSATQLLGLLGLQALISWGYTVRSYHIAPGAMPAWLQLVLVALAPPALSFLAGFLIPLQPSPKEVLADASAAMLQTTTTNISKQWQTRLKTAQREGHNLAPVAVALLRDSGAHEDATRLELMDTAIPSAGGKTPTKPPNNPKPQKGGGRKAPTRKRSDIVDLQAERRQKLLQHMESNPRTTLDQAQALMGMRNRNGAQTIWHSVQAELGIREGVAV